MLLKNGCFKIENNSWWYVVSRTNNVQFYFWLQLLHHLSTENVDYFQAENLTEKFYDDIKKDFWNVAMEDNIVS